MPAVYYMIVHILDGLCVKLVRREHSPTKSMIDRLCGVIHNILPNYLDKSQRSFELWILVFPCIRDAEVEGTYGACPAAQEHGQSL